MVKKGSKLICMVLVPLMAVSVFAGCTKKEEPAASEGDKSAAVEDTKKEQAPAEKVKIQYFSNKTGQQEFIQGMIDKYNKDNKDNVEVETIWRTGDFATGLKTSLLSGQGPTVMTSHGYSNLNDVILDGIVDAWDNYISPEFSKKYDKYKEKKLVNGEWKAYGWGYTELTRKLIYNKDLFKKVGEAEPPKTWDDVRRIAKKITEEGKGDFYGVAYPMGKGQLGLWIDTLCWSIGRPSFYDYGKAQYDLMPLVPVIKTWREMIKDGSVFPGYENMDNDAVRAQFANGKVGMLLSFSWDISCINEQYSAVCDWEAATLPTADGANYIPDKWISNENYLYSKASEDQKKAAGKFIEFFMSDEFVGGYMSTGAGLAAIDSAVEYAKKLPQPNKQFASYAPEAGGDNYTGRSSPSVTMEGDDRPAVIANCLLDLNKDIETAMKDLTERTNAGMVKYAETNVAKMEKASITIDDAGKLAYIEGWVPTKPADFTKFKYLSLDEWKALQEKLK